MNNISERKDNILVFFISTLLFLFSSKGWIESNLVNIRVWIYLLFFLFFIMSYQNIFSYLTYAYKEKFRQVDFLIFFSLLIFFLVQKSISFEALSFIGLFLLISSHAFEADRRPYTFNLIFKGILYSSLVSLLGVYLGFFESLFFDSTLFHLYQGENYPNPVLAFFKEAFGIVLSSNSGFQISINYSAYIIISCIGVLNLLNIQQPIKRVLKYLLFIGLVLTFAKVAYLFISIVITLHLIKGEGNIFKILSISSLAIAYLFLTHITLINSEALITDYKYYRLLIGNYLGMDFYLSLFAWLKVQAIDYIFQNNIASISLVGFKGTSGGIDPHSLFFYSVLTGGYLFAVLVLIKGFVNMLSFASLDVKKDKYFLSLLIVFFIESFIWDPNNTPVFWIIVLFCPFYKAYLSAFKMDFK
tara:strand:+ start:1694 stop:2938 length:1245 start_codon:yes stop_codon:yes gene_type:complete